MKQLRFNSLRLKSPGDYGFDNGDVAFSDLTEKIGKVARERQEARERYHIAKAKKRNKI